MRLCVEQDTLLGQRCRCRLLVRARGGAAGALARRALPSVEVQFEVRGRGWECAGGGRRIAAFPAAESPGPWAHRHFVLVERQSRRHRPRVRHRRGRRRRRRRLWRLCRLQPGLPDRRPRGQAAVLAVLRVQQRRFFAGCAQRREVEPQRAGPQPVGGGSGLKTRLGMAGTNQHPISIRYASNLTCNVPTRVRGDSAEKQV